MTKHLVQLLLPLADNEGRSIPNRYWHSLEVQLADAFGGVTAYTRAPADGIWAPQDQKMSKDSIFIVEVMTDSLDEVWWAELRLTLERDLEQNEIVIRAIPISRL